MPNQPSLNRALLKAAGSTALLTALSFSACSSQVKVQRVVYDEPVAVAEPQQTQQPVELNSESILAKASFDHPDAAPQLNTIAQVRVALEKIYDLDAQLVSSSMQQDPNRIHSQSDVAAIDRRHAQTLMTVIERFGWPSREMVGLKGVQGAYIAVQHAGHNPAFQSNCLALIQQQVDQGELPGAFLALMTDRVSVSRGDAQIYGTQMTMASDEYGVMHAVPAAEIWEAEELDQRRQALGMPSHQRFIEAIELAYFDSIGQSRVSSVTTD